MRLENNKLFSRELYESQRQKQGFLSVVITLVMPSSEYGVPSLSLLHWQNDRLARLIEIEAHCGAAVVLIPPNVLLAEESLRGYVVLLSGHFQGFCRDLYTECIQASASPAPLPLQATIQAQFTAEMKLNSSNPTVETLRKDF